MHGEHADQGFLDNQQFLMVLGMTVDKSYTPFVVGLKEEPGMTAQSSLHYTVVPDRMGHYKTVQVEI